jgi:hypothetical protein
MLQTNPTIEEDPKMQGSEVGYNSKITMYSGNGVHVKIA